MLKIPKFNEFINENEFKDKEIFKMWKDVYGKDFIHEHPSIYKILKQRPHIDKYELKRMWDEVYDLDFEKEHPEVYSKLS